MNIRPKAAAALSGASAALAKSGAALEKLSARLANKAADSAAATDAPSVSVEVEAEPPETP